MPSSETIEKYSLSLAFCTSLGLSLVLTFQPIWQLVIAAGLAGGFWCTKMKRGAIGGTGVGIGWLIYASYMVATTKAWVVLDQVGGVIMGPSGLGSVVLLLVVLMGTLFGVLGGSIGSAIRILRKTPDS